MIDIILKRDFHSCGILKMFGEKEQRVRGFYIDLIALEFMTNRV